ncbi:hypothetical protein ANO14919_058530 [Xylariales sp. No.14919]|nr:hypothetical protein F5X98DRAFT_384606 [Xylaria grammica]GAW16426.1 hypothetical protein ANO14919_058530 [Xylariales sp. No.14919]
MKPSLLSPWQLWALLCLQATTNADPTASELLSRGHRKPQSQPGRELPGAWGYCGSKYGLEPADAAGALSCATVIAQEQGHTISVGRDDAPRLLCDKYGAKIWIAPYLNQGALATKNTFTFGTVDVLNLTIQGAVRCCDVDAGPTCSGWGILTDTPGNNALISINHADQPEPVACNDAGLC